METFLNGRPRMQTLSFLCAYVPPSRHIHMQQLRPYDLYRQIPLSDLVAGSGASTVEIMSANGFVFCHKKTRFLL